MIPTKRTIKDESFYLYGYELASTTTYRTLVRVKRHLRIRKVEETTKKTA